MKVLYVLKSNGKEYYFFCQHGEMKYIDKTETPCSIGTVNPQYHSVGQVLGYYRRVYRPARKIEVYKSKKDIPDEFWADLLSHKVNDKGSI